MRRILLLLLLQALVCLQGTARAESAELALDRNLHATVQSYSIAGRNLLEALARLSTEFDLPMGIEWELSTVPYHVVNRTYQGPTTPFQILRDLVALEPPYGFTIGNGVIHVGKDTIFYDSRNFLNIRIGRFQASSEYIFDLSYRRLYPAVLEQANPSPKNEALGCAGSNTIAAGDRKISFYLQDATVRDVLDRFVTSAGFNIWLVTFPETKSMTSKGFFRTISIFSPNLPETKLPIWDLLRPGYDPVRREEGLGWRRAAKSTP
jgi:hypothetical protein